MVCRFMGVVLLLLTWGVSCRCLVVVVVARHVSNIDPLTTLSRLARRMMTLVEIKSMNIILYIRIKTKTYQLDALRISY